MHIGAKLGLTVAVLMGTLALYNFMDQPSKPAVMGYDPMRPTSDPVKVATSEADASGPVDRNSGYGWRPCGSASNGWFVPTAHACADSFHIPETEMPKVLAAAQRGDLKAITDLINYNDRPGGNWDKKPYASFTSDKHFWIDKAAKLGNVEMAVKAATYRWELAEQLPDDSGAKLSLVAEANDLLKNPAVVRHIHSPGVTVGVDPVTVKAEWQRLKALGN